MNGRSGVFARDIDDADAVHATSWHLHSISRTRDARWRFDGQAEAGQAPGLVSVKRRRSAVARMFVHGGILYTGAQAQAYIARTGVCEASSTGKNFANLLTARHLRSAGERADCRSRAEATWLRALLGC